MKKTIGIAVAVMLLASCASKGQVVETTKTTPLDQAIGEAAQNIENRLEAGIIIALLNFSSPSEHFSEYVLEELSGYLVNGGKLVVVERKQLDLIRQEEQFQLSGEVSDESAQAIGKKLGAQVVVSGSLSDVGKSYRFRIKTLVVETAAITATSSVDINATEERIVSLLAGTKPPIELLQEDPLPEGILYKVIDERSVTITKYIGSDTDLHIPKTINGLPVTAIGESAFISCKILSSITIPSSITTIEKNAFLFCDNLSSVTIPSSVSNIGDFAFSMCKNLMNINVETRNSYYTSIDGVLFDKGGLILICFPQGKSGGYNIPSSVTTINRGSFYNCYSLTGIGIPYSVTTIGELAFYSCRGLTSITIPTSVNTIGNSAFSNCTSLINITIPTSVTTIGRQAFSNCINLTFVAILGTDRNITGFRTPSSILIIEDYAFNECINLETVTVSRNTTIGKDAFPDGARVIYSD